MARPVMTTNELYGGWKPEQHFKAGDSVRSTENEEYDGTPMSKQEV